jgi:hypothetical protein
MRVIGAFPGRLAARQSSAAGQPECGRRCGGESLAAGWLAVGLPRSGGGCARKCPSIRTRESARGTLASIRSLSVARASCNLRDSSLLQEFRRCRSRGGCRRGGHAAVRSPRVQTRVEVAGRGQQGINDQRLYQPAGSAPRPRRQCGDFRFAWVRPAQGPHHARYRAVGPQACI